MKDNKLEWLKEYVNSLILQYDDEIINNLNDKEYNEFENRVFDLVKKNDDFWNTIDNNIINVIGSVIEEHQIDVDTIKKDVINKDVINKEIRDKNIEDRTIEKSIDM